jgi:hypothetical protein
MITLVEFGKSTTMPPVKPHLMALAVIISICCAFSGYLEESIVKNTKYDLAVLLGMLETTRARRHTHIPLQYGFSPSLQRVIQAGEEGVEAFVGVGTSEISVA